MAYYGSVIGAGHPALALKNGPGSLNASAVPHSWQFSPVVSALLLASAVAYLVAARQICRRHARRPAGVADGRSRR